MTSGFNDAALNNGPMTIGKYCSNSFPMILHILAQAAIMYEIWKETRIQIVWAYSLLM